VRCAGAKPGNNKGGSITVPFYTLYTMSVGPMSVSQVVFGHERWNYHRKPGNTKGGSIIVPLYTLYTMSVGPMSFSQVVFGQKWWN